MMHPLLDYFSMLLADRLKPLEPTAGIEPATC